MLLLLADVSQAVQAVRRLRDDPALLDQFAANGRAFVQQFATDIQADKWHQILQGLCRS